MKKKTLVLMILLLTIFGMYFIGKNVKFKNNISKINLFAGNVEDIKDVNLRQCVSYQLEQGAELANLTSLDCSYKSIGSLEGIKVLSNLQNINLEGNYINYADDLAEIPTLRDINLSNNYIDSIDVKGLSNLSRIVLKANRIKSMKDVDLPSTITNLDISNNELSGAIDLSQFQNLSAIYIHTNSAMTSLKLADLSKLLHMDISDTSIYSPDSITDGTNKLSSVSNQLKSLAVNGFTWSDTLKNLIIANAGTLENLQIGRTGITNIDFLTSNASSFTNLRILNLGVNDLKTLDLTGLNKLEEILLDSCNLSSLNIGNKGIVKRLYLGNNKLTSFDTNGYTSLEYLDLHQNPLTNFDFSSLNTLKVLNLSFIDLKDSFSINKIPSNIEYLYLVSTKLDGSKDFSSLAALRHLNIQNEDYRGANKNNTITSLKINPNLALLNASISTLNSLNVDGESKLEILDIVDSKISSIDFTKFKNIRHLGLASTSKLTSLDLTPIKDSLRELTMNSSALVDTFVFPNDLPRLTFLGINAEQQSKLDIRNYHNLALISVGYYDYVHQISSSKKIDVDEVLSEHTAEGIETSSNYELYDGMNVSERMNKVDNLELDNNNQKTFHIIDYDAEFSKLNLENYKGIIRYSAYYTVKGVLFESDLYTIDESANFIDVKGEKDPDKILSHIILNDPSATKKIEGNKLIITIGDTEKVYYLDVDFIDDEKGKNSLDPKNNYETTENPNTGVIFSIIALIVLIAAGIVSKYYLDYKKKHDELIEKI